MNPPTAKRDVFAELSEIIGPRAALTLCDAFPGLRLTLPRVMSADHPIALHIGLKAAAKLVAFYGREPVVVPMNTRHKRAVIRQAALAEYRSGVPAAEVCVKHGVHLFTLYRWAGEEQAKRQLDLI
ncbi:MAG: transposase [Panacagrimonas sp.]